MILKTTQDKNILKINSKSHLVDYIHQVFQLLLSWRPAKGSHHLKTLNLARFEVHPHVDEVLEGGFERVVVMMIGLVITRGPQTLSSAD